jgi:hypothetical protein
MRGEVVFPALFWPLLTELGERVDRSVNYLRVGASIVENVMQVILAPAQPIPKPLDMLEQTEILPSALLRKHELASRVSNGDVRSRGPAPQGAGDIHWKADHFGGRATGSRHRY